MTSNEWTLVQPEIAKFTRVCSYDRAGFGWSESGPPADPVEVLHTLLEAILLVVLVVVLFLQNWRASLIPLVSVPVSLIGTFAAMSA